MTRQPPATGNLALDAVIRRLQVLVPDLQSRGPRGGWTGYYRGHDLIVMVRPAPGSAIQIEVTSPLTGWSARLRSPDLDATTESALAEAVEQADQLGESPLSPLAATGGASGIGLLLLLVTSLGRMLEQGRDAVTHSADTLAAVRAATHEQRMRENSLSIGCLGAVGVWFGSTLLVVKLSTLLAGSTEAAATAGAFGVMIGPFAGVAALWALRRRYPSPPRTSGERLIARVFVIAGIVIVVLLALTIALNQGRAAQAAAVGVVTLQSLG